MSRQFGLVGMLRVVLGGLQLPLPVAHRRAVRGQAFDVPGKERGWMITSTSQASNKPLGLNTRILYSATGTEM